MLTRRSLLCGAAALSLPRSNGPTETPLRDLAARKNILFGSEITCADIADPAYAALVARECAIVTPGLEAKWVAVEPAERRFKFGPMDRVAGFAARHGLRLHMHNLVWALGLPPWTLQALQDGRGAQIMARHIGMLAARYRTQTESWDVINEPADPRWPSGDEGLCNTPWRRALGADYVGLALRAAHEAAPEARLLINDDDLEYGAPDRDKKRTIYLRLIETWLRQGVPLHGFGLEAHLKPWQEIAEKPYRRFLAELAGFGLRLYVTELDVCDRTLPADKSSRDAAVAKAAQHYLDLVLDEPAVCTVITWGLSDRCTWMSRDPMSRRPDLLPSRPLPYDEHLAAKPMRDALVSAFRHARSRPA